MIDTASGCVHCHHPMPHIVKSTSRHPHHRIEWLDMGIFILMNFLCKISVFGHILCLRHLFGSDFGRPSNLHILPPNLGRVSRQITDPIFPPNFRTSRRLTPAVAFLS